VGIKSSSHLAKDTNDRISDFVVGNVFSLSCATLPGVGLIPMKCAKTPKTPNFGRKIPICDSLFIYIREEIFQML